MEIFLSIPVFSSFFRTGDHEGRPYASAQFSTVGGGALDAPPVGDGFPVPNYRSLREGRP